MLDLATYTFFCVQSRTCWIMPIFRQCGKGFATKLWLWMRHSTQYNCPSWGAICHTMIPIHQIRNRGQIDAWQNESMVQTSETIPKSSLILQNLCVADHHSKPLLGFSSSPLDPQPRWLLFGFSTSFWTRSQLLWDPGGCVKFCAAAMEPVGSGTSNAYTSAGRR